MTDIGPLSQKRLKPTLVVMLDGVVHDSSKAHRYDDGYEYGPPVAGALKWLWKATEWFMVVIQCPRFEDTDGVKHAYGWFLKNSAFVFGGGHPMSVPPREGIEWYPLSFTHEAKQALVRIDARCVEFYGPEFFNDVEAVNLAEYKAWYERPAVLDPVLGAQAPRDLPLETIITESLHQVMELGSPPSDGEIARVVATAIRAAGYTDKFKNLEAAAIEQRSQYDCLLKIRPDEPFFVLRGQDSTADEHVERWCTGARAAGCPNEKVTDALRIADFMRRYHTRKRPD